MHRKTHATVMHDVYLIPGFFGFANLGKLSYFGHARARIQKVLATRGVKASVHVVRTIPTASLPRRTARLAEVIAKTASQRSTIHLIGHSSGGLDARLLLSPFVQLPTKAAVETLAARTRTLVTIATPHYGTPLASFFTGMLGVRTLHVLSLSTIYVLRYGNLPLRLLLQLAALFSRLDDLALNSALLDEVFTLLLRKFSVGRRRAVQELFEEVRKDQSLLVQLTPASMELFNATARDRPTTRYGSVVTRAHPPGVVSTLLTGLDPSAQALHAVYGALYRLTAQTPVARLPRLTGTDARMLRQAYGILPHAQSNDGIVPTRSQVWGKVIHAAAADHLDVIGHFSDPDEVPPHIDWLATGTGFDRERFEAVWNDVVDFIVAS